MSEPTESLTPKQERAILALLSEPSLARAAAKAEAGERTLRDWLKLPAFRAAYRAARQQIVEHAIGQVQRASGRAVKTLVRLLQCGHAGTEAKAAVSLLDFALRGVEVDDLAQQIEELRAELERWLSSAAHACAHRPCHFVLCCSPSASRPRCP